MGGTIPKNCCEEEAGHGKEVQRDDERVPAQNPAGQPRMDSFPVAVKPNPGGGGPVESFMDQEKAGGVPQMQDIPAHNMASAYDEQARVYAGGVHFEQAGAYGGDAHHGQAFAYGGGAHVEQAGEYGGGAHVEQAWAHGGGAQDQQANGGQPPPGESHQASGNVPGADNSLQRTVSTRSPHGSGVDLYGDGSLCWRESVPAERVGTNLYRPLVEPGPGEKWLCFLNEPRVLFSKFTYRNYNIKSYYDSGPPSLDQIVEACRLLEEALQASETVVVYCPEGTPFGCTRRFSALCLAAHAVLARQQSAAETAHRWRTSFRGRELGGTALDFASHSFAALNQPPPPNSLLFEDCLDALEVAQAKAWFTLESFDTHAFRELARSFDATWLVPGDMLVLADPMSTILDPDPATATSLVPKQGEDPRRSRSFAILFQLCGVVLLVKVNQSKEPGLIDSYNPQDIQAYTDHMTLDVTDTVPRGPVIQKIISKANQLREKKSGAVAIHCKSGFGRSIVCAVVMLVHRYQVSGRMASAWARLCRPGCINHPDQAELLVGLDTAKAAEYLKGKAGGNSLFSMFKG